MTTQNSQPYDFAAWQDRLGITATQAAEALDISVTFYHSLRRAGAGRKLYAWAAYGIECHATKDGL